MEETRGGFNGRCLDSQGKEEVQAEVLRGYRLLLYTFGSSAMSHGNSTRGSDEVVYPRTGILGMSHSIVQGL